MAKLGFVPVEELKSAPEPILFPQTLPKTPDLPVEPENIASRIPDKPAIKRGDYSYAARLLKNDAFRRELGICLSPEKLREILPELDKVPYFKKNKLRAVKILEMRYLGKGNGGSPLSKAKIGKILGDFTRPTVSDWLNRIFLAIRELAAEG